MSQRLVLQNFEGLQVGDELYHGGRIFHVGSAALVPGQAFTYTNDASLQNGARQKRAVRNMIRAVRQDMVDVQNVELAALQLEEEFTFARNSNLSKLLLNENVLMSTQRWNITSLPLDVVRQCIRVALLYQKSTKAYEPLIDLEGGGVPNPQVTFSSITATKETRPDIIALLNTLLQTPASVSCHVFSESDNQITTAWRGFEFLPDSTLSNDMSPLELVHAVQNANDSMTIQVCYWCQKSVLSCQLKTCARCESVMYCGRECQSNDWKAFHKVECPQLKSGKTKHELLMSCSRMDTLKMDGEQRATLPFAIAPAHDNDSVWRGDLLLLYVTHCSPDGTLGEKTKGFPTGWHIRPRETL